MSFKKALEELKEKTTLTESGDPFSWKSYMTDAETNFYRDTIKHIKKKMKHGSIENVRPFTTEQGMHISGYNASDFEFEVSISFMARKENYRVDYMIIPSGNKPGNPEEFEKEFHGTGFTPMDAGNIFIQIMDL